MLVSAKQASTLLQQGRVVAVCTEGVYGLSCDPCNSLALKRVFHMKHRAFDKPVAIVGSKVQHFERYVELSNKQLELIFSIKTLKPTTYLVKASKFINNAFLIKNNKIAIRLTNHKALSLVCDFFSGCVVSTSANLTNQSPCTEVSQLEAEFGVQLPIVEGLLTNKGQVSTLVDYTTKKIVRP